MIRTVVWDVDDVLNDLMRSWLVSVWAPDHPSASARYADLDKNPPDELLGLSRTEYLFSLDEFRLGTGYALLEPNPAILTWLEGEGRHCRHIALTATPLSAAPATASWVLRHFGRWIREFAFIPAAREGEILHTYDANKGAWLAGRGLSWVLVDDSPLNLAMARASGVAALPWPQPWNDGVSATETLQALSRYVVGGDAP